MRTMLIVACALTSMVAWPQEATFNVKGRNGEAIVPDAETKQWSYDGRYNFSPGFRAGDFVFLSGVVAGARDAEPLSRDAFKASVRRGFESIQKTLAAAGGSIEDVVKIRTFHVFDSPLITIDKRDQVLAIAEVKNEFIPEPHPAWTAVGTTALLPDRGLVEIEVVAYSPQR